MKTLLIAALVMFQSMLTVSTAQAAGADAGLYDPLPPAGSAFVRYINAAKDATGSKAVGANGKSSEYPHYAEVTPYFVVPKGDAKLAFGDVTKTAPVAEGKFYTVIWRGGKDLLVLEDPANDNKTKSQIVFYNLSGADGASLKSKDGKLEIIAAQKDGAEGSRQINPVKVEMAVYNGAESAGEVGAVSLERGMSYAAVFFGAKEKVVWARSTTNTTR